MRSILSIMVVLIYVTLPAQAEKEKKVTVTEAEYAELRQTYHYICDQVQDFEWTIPLSEVEGWCSAMSRVMRKTGHLPSFAPEKKKAQTEVISKKMAMKKTKKKVKTSKQ